jgi:hypothetical protein
MCARCDEIDERIAHYRWLREQIRDDQVLDSAANLMAMLEIEKHTLHPKE